MPFANFTVLSDHQNFFRHVDIFTGFASNPKIVLEVVIGEGGDVRICQLEFLEASFSVGFAFIPL